MGQGGCDAWVFAYGSLMWRPDFQPAEAITARLWGYHRAMCILSNHYRGTDDRPGLVLGLDRGGSCRGRALRIAALQVAEVVARLYEREMVHGVYFPRLLPVSLEDGRKVNALAFVVDRRHTQYHRASSLEEAAALVRQGVGLAGSSRDYLAQTVAEMTGLGISRGSLHRLLQRVKDE
ncbi:putative cation transport protein chaC-related [Candidatus Terasakiella magnetica]|nr:putative cation transport protein chaC-related [Candidatus Terasakiella magnetica]